MAGLDRDKVYHNSAGAANMDSGRRSDIVCDWPPLEELMKGYVDDIERATLANEDFRRVLYTGKNLQLVLMTLPPGCDIGEEVHEDRDQFFRIEEGEGEIRIDGVANKVEDDFAVIVPAGARHNVINTGTRAAQALHDLRPARASRRRRPRDQGAGRARPRQRPLGRRDDGVVGC